jgi:molybdenum cofactor guanylyltransferase
MEKKHQKHAKLIKPAIGFFGRNEFAFVGTNCESINLFANLVIKHLDKSLNISFVDADHSIKNDEIPSINYFQDKISFKRLDKKNINVFEQKFMLADQDLILVNGNHFEAKQQIVFIDDKKEESLKKRIGQLTNIKAIFLTENKTEIFDWLKENVTEKTPIFKISEIEKIAHLINASIIMPPLKALILAGGKSLRMGEDKAHINYQGKPQVAFLLEQFSALGIETYVSCREDQKEIYGEKALKDKFIDLGPYGAILSAFQSDPDAAWFVMACDLPLIRKEEMAFLVSKRNSKKTATACFNPETELPDPLFTIWEPKAYLPLLNYLTIGYSCPRKVLINSDIELVILPNAFVLKNVNTPEDKEEIIGKI